ncbi:hypothetical protein EHQ58_10000 [Leptospira ognonensis]|uniref:Uncharacterized protein n=1 Tax=Leptospira ognonensis TaxID=2484945 RepID=A0A4V3JR82_9LEPT|nr:hypothetical protein [Leptospira ognonensis]TGL59005.1 hypothetical protein EHQ58_10000 [Leptospira ognonensis]
MKISLDEFKNKINTVVNLPINLAWQGYGSAIFLELGTIQDFKGLRQNHKKGESCIQIEWDWRVEYKTKVLFGSSNQIPEIGDGIKKLIGTSIK